VLPEGREKHGRANAQTDWRTAGWTTAKQNASCRLLLVMEAYIIFAIYQGRWLPCLPFDLSHCTNKLAVVNHCPLSINIYLTWHNISVLSRGISMKLETNIRHVSGHWWQDFRSQRAKFKVTVRPHAILLRMLTYRQCVDKACLLPCCMECQRGLATRKVSVCLSLRLTNAWFLTKRKKVVPTFLYRTKDHSS